MKKLWLVILVVASLGTVCLAADKVEAPAACKQCGMDRSKYAHSRMVVTYTDGTSTGTCSINCVMTDIKESKIRVVKFILVADYYSKKLTDAKTATWVIGGSKGGVMTPVAKWAFADRKDAEAFIKKNGGKTASFEAVVEAVEKEHADRPQVNKHQEHKGHVDHKM